MKKQRFKDGAIVRIPIDDERCTYGQLFAKVMVMVFDCLCKISEPVDLDKVSQSPLLFTVGVYKDIISRGKFEIVGQLPISNDILKQVKPNYHQSLPNIEECYLLYWDGTEKKVSPEECIGLDPVSVWDEDHVAYRLMVHYDKIHNKYTGIFEVKLPQR